VICYYILRAEITYADANGHGSKDCPDDSQYDNKQELSRTKYLLHDFRHEVKFGGGFFSLLSRFSR